MHIYIYIYMHLFMCLNADIFTALFYYDYNLIPL